MKIYTDGSQYIAENGLIKRTPRGYKRWQENNQVLISGWWCIDTFDYEKNLCGNSWVIGDSTEGANKYIGT